MSKTLASVLLWATILLPAQQGNAQSPHHYLVHYWLDGERHRVLYSSQAAHSLVHRVRSSGGDGEIVPSENGRHDVWYWMDGDRRRTFHSHHHAHQFADQLRALGFTARVFHPER
jgi:hypothetical protein